MAHADTIYAEVPSSAGEWYYRTLVRNGGCPEAYSEEITLRVNPKEILVIPDVDQFKNEGEPDPVFTFTNSEWSDNSYFTGTLGRVPGELAGEYPYMMGDLSAGGNYSLILDTGPGFSILDPTGFSRNPYNGDLQLQIMYTRQFSSPLIHYTLPHEGEVSIRVSNLSGQFTDFLLTERPETGGDHFMHLEEMNLEQGIYLVSLLFKGRDVQLIRNGKLVVY